MSGAFSVSCVMIGGTYYVSGALIGFTLSIVTVAADLVGDVLFDLDKLEIELTAEDLPSTASDASLDNGLYPSPVRQIQAVRRIMSRQLAEVQGEHARQLRQQQTSHDNAVAHLSAQHATRMQQIVEVERTQTLTSAQADLHLQLAEKDRQLKQKQDRLSAKHQADMQALKLETASAHEKNVIQLQSNVHRAQSQTEALRLQLVREQRQADLVQEELQADLGQLHAKLNAEVPHRVTIFLSPNVLC